MNSSVCDHVVYVEDRGSHAVLHLTLGCARAGVATSHDVNGDHCAVALDDWLRACPGRILLEFVVTTSRVHHGCFAPLGNVLARRRPEIHRLGLGAVTFPDFDRGSYLPEDSSRDGSSWHLSVPALEELVVQCNSIDTAHSTWSAASTHPLPRMTRLRRMILRAGPPSVTCADSMSRATPSPSKRLGRCAKRQPVS
jgi:hypothetical protein